MQQARLQGEFAVIDEALYRVVHNGDPHEGRDSQKIYVPPALRAALMKNYTRPYGRSIQHSTSMFKQINAWCYWREMEKDIQRYVSTCELCQLSKGTKPLRQGFLGGWGHSKVLHTIRMDLADRDIGAALSDTIFYIQMMEKLGPAIRGKYPTAHVKPSAAPVQP